MRRRDRPHAAGDTDVVGAGHRVPGDDEHVVAVVRGHWWALAGPCAVVAVALAATAVLLGTDPPEAASLLAVAVLVAAAARLVVRYARWAARRLVVTSERLILRRGVLDRRTDEVPLGAVAGVAVHQSMRQRALRAGDLEVGIAGGAAPLVVADVPSVTALAGHVGRLARDRGARPAPPPPADATTVWPGV